MGFLRIKNLSTSRNGVQGLMKFKWNKTIIERKRIERFTDFCAGSSAAPHYNNRDNNIPAKRYNIQQE